MNRFCAAESATEGHPDKLADKISDAIVDACLTEDPESRVAIETLVSRNQINLAGEVTTRADVDFTAVALSVVRELGTIDGNYGLTEYTPVHKNIQLQSRNLSKVVTGGGAGDQGVMVGYATSETPEYMPLATVMAHRLTQLLTLVRKTDDRGYSLRPDGKAQVVVEYAGHIPIRVDSIIVSAQHLHGSKIRGLVFDEVIVPAVKQYRSVLCDFKTHTWINPDGEFVVGGAAGDTGVTGRKIISDTYGGAARHGGGAFSGKDPSKMDRSGAYMARCIAKNIVHSKLAERCEVTLAYSINVAEPVMVEVEAFGTQHVPIDNLVEFARLFPMTPQGIIEFFNLKRPIYKQAAVGGHFGRPEFPWEKI